MGCEMLQRSCVSPRLKNRREKWKSSWLDLPRSVSTAYSDLPALLSHQVGVVGAGAHASKTCL